MAKRKKPTCIASPSRRHSKAKDHNGLPISWCEWCSEQIIPRGQRQKVAAAYSTCKLRGDWCNGSTAASKTADDGSIPSSSATTSPQISSSPQIEKRGAK